LITFDDAYAELARHALPVLQDAGFPSLVFAVTERLGTPNSWDSPPPRGALPRLMDADEIARWARRGVEFGAHSRTHRDLTTLSRGDLQAEIHGSRADLEELVQQPVGCFAYPYGSHHAVSRELVSGSYSLAFTASEGLNGLATASHLQRRLSVSPTERLAELEWRLRFGRIPLSRLRAFRARAVDAAERARSGASH
jgi:peptidoglycan/xylan/chitin deacetylase (PgdA/CDA1 family)